MLRLPRNLDHSYLSSRDFTIISTLLPVRANLLCIRCFCVADPRILQRIIADHLENSQMQSILQRRI